MTIEENDPQLYDYETGEVVVSKKQMEKINKVRDFIKGQPYIVQRLDLERTLLDEDQRAVVEVYIPLNYFLNKQKWWQLFWFIIKTSIRLPFYFIGLFRRYSSNG